MAAYEVPPSPDYIPGPEVPPSPDYIPGPEDPPSPDYVPGPEEPEQAPPSPVYLPYGMDDDEEEGGGHASSWPTLSHLYNCMTAMILSGMSHPYHFLLGKRYHHQHPIALLILIDSSREVVLSSSKRVRFTSPTPSPEVRESSAAGAARQDRPTIAREDLYGFIDMVDVPPRCSTSRELDYGITEIHGMNW
ncbi:hypothetical protein Tco_0680304 [Tanacetum coccineum]|uniref:Uncharacterized protein n=1 Tax=Tanacetum coccineum TaxID=301880 RepID=A0ABQ4XLM1_9ASTR